jgi:hypothetical protein
VHLALYTSLKSLPGERRERDGGGEGGGARETGME